MATVGATLSNVTELSVLVLAVFGLVDRSCTTPATMLAVTVPDVIIPVTATFQVMLSAVVGICATPPVDVPPTVMSPAVKVAGLIAVLKTTVKLIGLAFVGSACPPAWSIDTVTGVLLKVTVLSPLVLARLRLPAASAITPAPMDAVTVPVVVMPVTATFQVMLSAVVGVCAVPPVEVP